MKTVKTILALFVLAVVCTSAVSAAGSGDAIFAIEKRTSLETREALDALLYDYDVLEIDTATIAERVTQKGAVSIHLGNRTFDLALQLNDLRAPNYKAVIMRKRGPVEVDPGPVTTYAGTLLGDPASVVRVTVTEESFTGYVRTAEEWVFVDSLSRYVDGAPSSAVVLYKDEDVRPEAAGLCGSSHIHEVASDLEAEAPEGLILANRAPRRLQVANEADGQFFQRYGNPGTFNQMQSILNGVDGIYRTDLNLFISITYQQAWPTAGGDPYTSLNAETTLNQFRSWWNANRGGTVRDTAHMFSGKNFSGGTIGIAWVGVICNNPSLSYGISEDQRSGFLNRQLTAHEIGHNLSARHDNQSPVCPGVSCNSRGPVMCSFIQSNGTNRFSSCSKSSVASHVANFGSCLN